MGHGLWVMATKSLQTKLGNAKPYGLLGSMGYTWYTLGGSLLYYSSGRLGRSQVRNVGCHGVVMATSRDSSPTISFPLFSTSHIRKFPRKGSDMIMSIMSITVHPYDQARSMLGFFGLRPVF